MDAKQKKREKRLHKKEKELTRRKYRDRRDKHVQGMFSEASVESAAESVAESAAESAAADPSGTQIKKNASKQFGGGSQSG